MANSPSAPYAMDEAHEHSTIVARGLLNSPSFLTPSDDTHSDANGDNAALFRSLKLRERARLLNIPSPEESCIVSPPPDSRAGRQTRGRDCAAASNASARRLVNKPSASTHLQRPRKALADITGTKGNSSRPGAEIRGVTPKRRNKDKGRARKAGFSDGGR